MKQRRGLVSSFSLQPLVFLVLFSLLCMDAESINIVRSSGTTNLGRPVTSRGATFDSLRGWAFSQGSMRAVHLAETFGQGGMRV